MTVENYFRVIGDSQKRDASGYLNKIVSFYIFDKVEPLYLITKYHVRFKMIGEKK